MIRRFLLASALLITGTIVAAPSAFAVDGDVTFSGIVSGTCVFGSTPVAGSITTSGANATSLSGTSATTDVTCNSPASLSVAAPVQDLGSILTGTKTSSVAASGTTLSANTTDTGTAITLVTGEKANLTVAMTAGNSGNIIPADTYAYTVTLTATP
ncbi:hypothetical protein [Nostoc sp.]|uniref:hypothetical protein n=1 Tax=Nostoc sp. TaxID=1180 RepID=UPI002FF6B179